MPKPSCRPSPRPLAPHRRSAAAAAVLTARGNTVEGGRAPLLLPVQHHINGAYRSRTQCGGGGLQFVSLTGGEARSPSVPVRLLYLRAVLAALARLLPAGLRGHDARRARKPAGPALPPSRPAWSRSDGSRFSPIPRPAGPGRRT